LGSGIGRWVVSKARASLADPRIHWVLVVQEGESAAAGRGGAARDCGTTGCCGTMVAGTRDWR
jgi:hypothetical protein